MGCVGFEGSAAASVVAAGVCFEDRDEAEGMWYFVVMRVCGCALADGGDGGGVRGRRRRTVFGRACSSRADWRCHSSLDVKYGIVGCVCDVWCNGQREY